MVEGRRRELRTFLGPALQYGKFLRLEILRDQVPHEHGSLGRELRRLDHSAVASREDAGERSEDQIEREILRTDDANHDYRHVLDPR